MGDIDVKQFLVAYFVSFLMIAVGGLVESLVFVGWVGGLVLGLVSLLLIINITKP